ncbi:MAG TPA: DUF6252 family protein [Chitinophagales bacterium]|jgi:hypothetical protein|nr:DUF6252 family protein [Chitinophagales bacterium]
MKKLIVFISVTLFLIACKKEDGLSGGGSGNMSFRVDGSLVSTNVWNASYGNLFPAFITTNITSNMYKDKRAVNININAVTNGTYNFIDGSTSTLNKAYGSYYPDYFGDISNTYQFTSGSFVVTSIDTIAKTFSGTFSGTATNSESGATVSITEGVVTNGTLVRF